MDCVGKRGWAQAGFPELELGRFKIAKGCVRAEQKGSLGESGEESCIDKAEDLAGKGSDGTENGVVVVAQRFWIRIGLKAQSHGEAEPIHAHAVREIQQPLGPLFWQHTGNTGEMAMEVPDWHGRGNTGGGGEKLSSGGRNL